MIKLVGTNVLRYLVCICWLGMFSWGRKQCILQILFSLKPVLSFGPQEFESIDHAAYWAYVYVNVNPYHIRGSANLHIAMIFQVVYYGKFLNKLCFLLIPILQPMLKFGTSRAWTNRISICTRLILIRRRNRIAG